MERAVFLDRDGVLNRSLIEGGHPVAPSRLEQFELLPGVPEAIGQLRAAGWRLIVVTNQPDVRTGKVPLERVEQMHRRLREWLPLDDIEACYHVDADGCDCRKPKPGMLWSAARRWKIDSLAECYMVGDRWRDVSAGKAAGCQTIFVDYGYGEKGPDEPDYVVHSLLEACPIILRKTRTAGVY